MTGTSWLSEYAPIRLQCSQRWRCASSWSVACRWSVVAMRCPSSVSYADYSAAANDRGVPVSGASARWERLGGGGSRAALGRLRGAQRGGHEGRRDDDHHEGGRLDGDAERVGGHRVAEDDDAAGDAADVRRGAGD